MDLHYIEGHAMPSAMQRADAEVQAAAQKVDTAQQLVPALPGIDHALVVSMRKGLFVNVISGALSQCAALLKRRDISAISELADGVCKICGLLMPYPDCSVPHTHPTSIPKFGLWPDAPCRMFCS